MPPWGNGDCLGYRAYSARPRRLAPPGDSAGRTVEFGRPIATGLGAGSEHPLCPPGCPIITWRSKRPTRESRIGEPGIGEIVVPNAIRFVPSWDERCCGAMLARPRLAKDFPTIDSRP